MAREEVADRRQQAAAVAVQLPATSARRQSSQAASSTRWPIPPYLDRLYRSAWRTSGCGLFDGKIPVRQMQEAMESTATALDASDGGWAMMLRDAAEGLDQIRFTCAKAIELWSAALAALQPLRELLAELDQD